MVVPRSSSATREGGIRPCRLAINDHTCSRVFARARAILCRWVCPIPSRVRHSVGTWWGVDGVAPSHADDGAVTGDDESDSVSDVQRLAEGVGVPVGAGAGSEADEADDHPRRVLAPVVALLLLARTQRSPQRGSAPFDGIGQLTAVLAMGGLIYGAIEAGAAGFTAPRVVAALTVAAAALAAFVAAQTRVAHPMMPLDLFRSRTVVITLAIGFAFMVGYYRLPFVMSLYLQQSRGLSALGTGVVFLPMMLIGAALTPFSAHVAERLGRKSLIAAGLLLMTVGLLTLGVAPESTPCSTPAARSAAPWPSPCSAACYCAPTP